MPKFPTGKKKNQTPESWLPAKGNRGRLLLPQMPIDSAHVKRNRAIKAVCETGDQTAGKQRGYGLSLPEGTSF